MGGNIKYAILAIISFFVGFIIYTRRNKDFFDEDYNKTIAVKEGNNHFLVFKGAVILSRPISESQYNSFLNQYPSSKAEGNILNKFSSPSPKYISENGRYYEYIWANGKYDSAVEITKDEYDFRKRGSLSSLVEVTF